MAVRAFGGVVKMLSAVMWGAEARAWQDAARLAMRNEARMAEEIGCGMCRAKVCTDRGMYKRADRVDAPNDWTRAILSLPFEQVNHRSKRLVGAKSQEADRRALFMRLDIPLKGPFGGLLLSDCRSMVLS